MISPFSAMIGVMSHDLFDLVLAAITLAGLGAATWAALHRCSGAARWLGRVAQAVGGPWPLALAFVSAILFAAVAEDVLRHESDEWVLRLDQSIQTIGRDAGRQPYVHAVARGVSLVTGLGLGAVVMAAAGVLAFTSRRPAAVMLLAGTVGGWIMYGTAKLIFRIPRPSYGLAEEAGRGYGFPSGHTVVTVVALGLLAWICGRSLTARGRGSLYAAAMVVVVLTGVSRVLLHAHWLSDVVAGVALGTLYLALVVGRFGSILSASPIPHTGGER
jgi:membrane-associated phospholipid phosphatase